MLGINWLVHVLVTIARFGMVKFGENQFGIQPNITGENLTT